MEPPQPIEDILLLPGVASAERIVPPKRAVFVGVQPWEEMLPLHMLLVNGLYLVATEDDLATWWMGQEADDGVIHIWGNYGALEIAIAGL
jgi:hypothetical protein